MTQASPYRWVVLAVFVLASALNYLDRNLLSAFVPTLLREFRINATEFSTVPVVFSLIYAASAPLMGLLLDRMGLRWGTSLLVAGWSLAGILTGGASSLGLLVACRAMLGFFESGGIPASSKAIATFLLPRERALGSALSQLGITIGSSAAPQLAAAVGPTYGWQTAFVIAGSLGFLWIPLWIVALIPAREIPAESRQALPSFGAILRDRRIWILIAANLIVMTGYSLWTQWTTLFLVRGYGLTEVAANRDYAWIPPIFATLGGLFGGSWAYRAIPAGTNPIPTRLRICQIAVVFLALSAAAPFFPEAWMATAAVSFCLFWTVTLSVNLYALPLDLFRAERAAFAVSLLTAAFGLTNALWSRVVGWLVDTASFTPVAVLSSLVPLLGVVVLTRGLRHEAAT